MSYTDPTPFDDYIEEAAEEIQRQYKRLDGKPLDGYNAQFIEMIRQYLIVWGITDQATRNRDHIALLLRRKETPAK